VPKSFNTRKAGEADPRDRPQKIELELFLSFMLHLYSVHRGARLSSRPYVNYKKAQVSEKNKSADPCDRPNPFTSHSLSIYSVDLMDEGKLGYGFTSADELEEVDIGPGDKPRLTFISKRLNPGLREAIILLLKEYADCFAWDYTEMPGLDRNIVEHRLPRKPGFRPFQQRARQMKAEVLEEVKKEVEKMIEAGFIRTCRYAEWISNVVPVQMSHPVFKAKTECITICMPGSSSIHIVTSSMNNQQQYHEKTIKRL
jgi:hypothetical protein